MSKRNSQSSTPPGGEAGVATFNPISKWQEYEEVPGLTLFDIHREPRREDLDPNAMVSINLKVCVWEEWYFRVSLRRSIISILLTVNTHFLIATHTITNRRSILISNVQFVSGISKQLASLKSVCIDFAMNVLRNVFGVEWSSVRNVGYISLRGGAYGTIYYLFDTLKSLLGEKIYWGMHSPSLETILDLWNKKSGHQLWWTHQEDIWGCFQSREIRRGRKCTIEQTEHYE